MRKPFYILGHRGTRNNQFYQNSPSALIEGMAGADGLETDAVLSADGVVFLIHETYFLTEVRYTLTDHLDEVSAARAGTRRLDQMSGDEIETFRLKNGEPIPRLDWLLETARAYPEAILNIELKADRTGVPVVDLVRKAIAAGHVTVDRIIVSSFNHPELVVVRDYAPEFKIGALFSLETQTRSLLYPWSDNMESCYTPFHRDRLDDPLMHRLDPEFINLELATLSVSNIAAIHAAFPKVQLMTWPIFEPKPEVSDTVMQMLRHLGEDGLLHTWITDEPRMRVRQMAAL